MAHKFGTAYVCKRQRLLKGNGYKLYPDNSRCFYYSAAKQAGMFPFIAKVPGRKKDET